MAKGACVVKGEGGVRGMHAPPTRYGRSMRGRYASYRNAFLFEIRFQQQNMETKKVLAADRYVAECFGAILSTNTWEI